MIGLQASIGTMFGQTFGTNPILPQGHTLTSAMASRSGALNRVYAISAAPAPSTRSFVGDETTLPNLMVGQCHKQKTMEE